MRTIYSNHVRPLTYLMLAALAALLVSCGGTVTTNTAATATAAARVQFFVSNTQFPSAGGAPLDVTAVVLNAAGQTVAGETVAFSTLGDPSAYFNSISGLSDSSGIVTAKLNIGSNKSNRTISLSATAGTAVGTNSVDVTGTTIAISGNSSLTFGASTTLTISVKDSAGTALPGITVSLSSQAGNTIAMTPATGITDASGQITATITATTAATTDVITATAAGATKKQNLSISNSSFTFTTPVANVLIPINTATPISLTWLAGTVPVAASSVNFSASRGVITGAAALTNASGVAAASITSSTTGSTIISAAGTGAGAPAATLNVTFYTSTASTVTAQANPSTVQVTTGTATQTSNSSVISVVVRDAANNLVQNALVNFSITADASGGSLSSASATTDAYGTASVNYIAGTVSSPQNGVTINASVSSINGVAIPTVSGNVSLTVSGQALMVRLGTDQFVVSTPPMNQKTYVAIVSDAGGNAVAGVTVLFKLRPNRYWKGVYVAGASKWTQSTSATCANEDNGGGSPTLAFNGIVDPGEDLSTDGALQPGGVATITPSAVTDVNGFATATISYPKDHSNWAEFIVEARTGVNSNDPPAQATFGLDGLAADYSNLSVNPPGDVSPYGSSAFCTDPL